MFVSSLSSGGKKLPLFFMIRKRYLFSGGKGVFLCSKKIASGHTLNDLDSTHHTKQEKDPELFFGHEGTRRLHRNKNQREHTQHALSLPKNKS
jgi:hypothetical protein